MVKKVCSFPGCGRPHLAKGLCEAHYGQQRRKKELVPHKDDVPPNSKPIRVCSVDGCGRKCKTLTLCATHRRQQLKGKPFTTIKPRIKPGESGDVCTFPNCHKPWHLRGLCTGHYDQLLSQRPLTALFNYYPTEQEYIDARTRVTDTGCVEWTGPRNDRGYGCWKLNGAHKLAHRVMFMRHHNVVLLPKQTLDHLCRNRACVNPAHLEIATQRENTKRMLAFNATAAERDQLKAENEALRAELERISGGKAA